VRRLALGRLGQLLVKCPACGALYPSGIFVDTEMTERDSDALSEVKTHCPNCGRMNVNKLKEMAFTTAIATE
jgi:uncharacterized Zn finger protein